MKKQMQAKEEEMRAGGREAYPIKINEIAGQNFGTNFGQNGSI